MVRWSRCLGAGLVLLLVSVGAGCNVFGGLSEENSDDPEVLLSEARAALTQGQPDRAVDLLREALAADSSNAEVRVELASAMLEARDVDIVTLRSMGRFIIGDEKRTSISNTHESGRCTFDQEPVSLPVFDYEDAPEYQVFVENEAVFEEVQALLGDERIDFEALAAELRARRLLVGAFADIATAVLEINRRIKALDATLYRLPSGAIGLCAPTPEDRFQLEKDIVCALLPRIEAALEELNARNGLIGREPDEGVIIDIVRDAIEAIRGDTEIDCTGRRAI